ncbi:rod shape-determining protein MreC [Pseudodesulfovibrio cashew]|uniref:Cell shape-determining protein MreC n=1 Tax=Pseudodesulfovibrio cashew TaxID=2678688 RepID=A0A6I6JF66_9BACT|nr:rod shape-determining protein MreC [Pseudodesulfovibrio cashew]QGY39819.1 rod shape-determining protein MreC [Pseudodesulfovibrio cashew]
MTRPKKIAAVFVAGLFVYLSMYTWNLRTGHLDALSSYTGLDISGFLLRPGLWVKESVTGFWERYVYLVDLKRKNDELVASVAGLKRENLLLRDKAEASERLERMLGFRPPEGWDFSGARIIAHRMGPAGVLDTMTVDQGSLDGAERDMPAVTLDGVAGRVLETGAKTSILLLLTDPNSHIAVLGESNRSPGMLTGQGYGQPLKLRFVNLNASIDPGEILVSSGLSGIYPKGLPVARVTKVQRSDISLFLSVEAEPLVDVSKQEEVLLLERRTDDGEPELVNENGNGGGESGEGDAGAE